MGFIIFVEEIRSFEDNKVKRADSEQVNIAKKLIKKLKFKYKVDQFQNPKLQNHWAAIEALALDLEEPESVNDNTCTFEYFIKIKFFTLILNKFLD